MKQERQRAPRMRLLLLLLLLLSHIHVNQSNDDVKKKFGDRCSSNDECGFEGAVCDDHLKQCSCRPEVPITNHLDKCGPASKINESCFFNEQCETVDYLTECKGGVCSCRFQREAITKPDGSIECVHDLKKKFGDKCSSSDECGFEGAVCDHHLKQCSCKPEVPITNHLDKCGPASKINESCFFNEQCETFYYLTECRGGICSCRFQREAITKPDGSIECIPTKYESSTPQRYVDPAMIGILVAMFLMFITICVVLRLFSKARWRENRTIFNTPNPRLMNVSLLRDNKLLHHERRGSKTSHGPSRPASMSSLQPQSPNSQGSRRGSKTSSVSGASIKTNKSPSNAGHSSATPMLKSVAVDIQGTTP